MKTPATLHDLPGNISFMWIPDHSNIADNEKTDEVTKLEKNIYLNVLVPKRVIILKI